MQVVIGPRQVGKSTLIRQLLDELQTEGAIDTTIKLVDMEISPQEAWIHQVFSDVRHAMTIRHQREHVLIFDEIQKIENWENAIKGEFDKDTLERRELKLILLGSSRLMLEKGLGDAMTGRFEIIRLSHWSFLELKEAFNLSFDEYLYFGAYPGAIPLRNDEWRYRDYIQSSIIDATINRDILVDTKVFKPTLLRRALELGCHYSGEIVSLNKILGELQDKGNITTITSYFNLLRDSGLVTAIPKLCMDYSRQRASIPKFQVFNNALKSCVTQIDFQTAIQNRSYYGRLVESSIGSYLLAETQKKHIDLFYWREKSNEVDFILKKNQKLVALEIKSNHESFTAGLNEFCKRFNATGLIVGPEGIGYEEFMQINLIDLF